MEYKNYNSVDLFSRKCELCGCKFRIIGLQRKNGRDLYEDWDMRKWQKKCYKK
jgi:hypothetical protein